MISVNQGIGTSIPEQLEKRGGHMMFHIKGGPLNVKGGVDTMEETMLIA